MSLIKYRDWTTKEFDYLKTHYVKQSDEEIAKRLNRTTYAIMVKRSVLGLRREIKRYSKYIIKLGYQERNAMITLHKKVTKMRELISIAEKETNRYKIDKIKEQLKKLSGL